MRKAIVGILLVFSLAIPAAASEIVPPPVPKSGQDRMPVNTDSFPEGLLEIIQKGIGLIHPEIKEAMQVCTKILFAALLFSILSLITDPSNKILSVAGTATVAAMIFQHTNVMVTYAVGIAREIFEYSKLLCPVLTTALAAQGGITASAALYTGTTFFITLLSTAVSKLIVPMVYMYLAFSIASSALENETMKRFASTVKSFLTWLLKSLLMVFTTYMSITGVISGTTDAAALKASKVAVSSFVPVVGGILSDASESILISMGMMKNAAGIYGILAVLSVFIGPFMKVGIQYLLLKCSALLCGIWGNKNISTLVEDFSSAMGLLLAVVASGCVFVLISTICFMKGIG